MPNTELPTLMNPFTPSLLLDVPFHRDQCTQIYAMALRSVVEANHANDILSDIQRQELKQRAYLYGAETYILHPDDIQSIFCGVTLRVYQAIDQLYCSLVGLSSAIIHQILHGFATRSNVKPITLEAVWAICRWLDKRRTRRTAPHIQRVEDTWLLGRFRVPITLREPNGTAYQPVLFTIVHGTQQRVLGLHIAYDERCDAEGLVFYQACALQREPALGALTPTGVQWKLPVGLVTDVELTAETQQACALLGIATHQNAAIPSWLHVLAEQWSKDFKHRMLTTKQFLHAFDTYMYRTLGTSPLRDAAAQERTHAHLVGYNREPSQQLPALRLLLPKIPGIVTEDGTVHGNKRIYRHEVLKLYPRSPVILRRVPSAEAAAWVYVENHILCLAKVQKGRRPDGVYPL